MGQSTNGQICFGIGFEEGYEFPWNEYDEIEDWWRDVNGDKPPFELFTPDGDGYVGGQRPPQAKVTEWYTARSAWDAANSLPIELVNVCSMSSPIYILAVASTVLVARRGYPEEFDPDKFFNINGHIKMLIDFCKKYDIDTDGEKPKWYLSSFWEV